MNIMVTGANGFIGSNLCNYLKQFKEYTLFNITRNNLNLYDPVSVKNYVMNNSINVIIHTAIDGGRRYGKDTKDEENIVYRNLLMFENIYNCKDLCSLVINIGSGAENKINDIIPTSYYGFSKYMISNKIFNLGDLGNVINLKLYGCFYHNENPERMIKSNLQNYINNKPMVIHQDKYMDFFYIEDFFKVIKYYLSNWKRHNTLELFKEIDLVYSKKYKLSDIVNIINGLDKNKKVEVIINTPGLGMEYTGDSTRLDILKLTQKGLIVGIQECYNKLCI